MFTELVVFMFVISTSIAQFDVFYAYPEQLYQGQTQDQLPSQLHQLQQPLEEPEPDTALYLMARQPNTHNNMYINNQIGTQDYNYQQANPTDYFENSQNQNFYQNQQNQNYYQNPMNPNPPNMVPGEYVSCSSNVLPNDCVNAVPSTTPPVRPTDCTYSGGAARNNKDSEEEADTPAPTTASTTTTTHIEPPQESADTINSSIAPPKNVPDEKTRYFLHQKKRKIRVHSPQNKLFVRKLVNETSKGKVLVPYRNTMSMINHAKDSDSLAHNA